MTTEEWWEMQDRVLWRALTMPRTYPCEHIEERPAWCVFHDCVECALAWRLAVAEHEMEENR